MARERFDQDTPYSPGTYGGVAATQDHWAGNGPVADAQGNVTGTVVQGTPSGEQSDVARYRDIGADMQKRDPYKFDWSQTDQDHSLAGQSAKSQDDANEAWRMQATGQDRTAFNYGKSLLDRGAQNQQGAAASVAGGPLAQVGANARAQNARAGFMQKGTQELEAQHADDMAAGRQGYAAGLAGTRKLDTQAQGLSDQATELEANAAAQQNKLNDAGQYGMEKMGVDVEGQAVAARQHQLATSDKMRADQQAASDAKSARDMATFNTVVGAVGNAAAPGAGTAFVAGGSAAQNASGDDPTSDERAKEKQPGALLSMLKKAPSISDAANGEEERNLQSEFLSEKGAKEDDSPEQQLQKEYVNGQPKQDGEPKSDQQTPANLFSSKQKPLLASVDKSDNQSISLPSDEIDANYKLAHQPATEANTAPAVTGYDNSMFKSNGQADGGDIGTDALHKGIEKGIARDQALDDARKDLAKDNRGVGGAPRGYAASRAGKPGDMFYGGEQRAQGGAWDEKHGVAPGTRDYLKYGNIEGGPDAAMQNARRTTKMDDFSQAVMTSDERAKNKVETPEEKKAREDKQDADDTAAFMKDAPKDAFTVKKPANYEEASKAIDERNEQDRQIKEGQQKQREAEGARYMANQDAELIRRANGDNWVPGFIKRWTVKGIEERAKNRTPQQNIDQAVARDKRDVERQKTQHEHDDMVPDFARKPLEDLKVNHVAATGRGREPVSIVRGDPNDLSRKEESVSDERAKDKAKESGYEDTAVHPLGVESKDGGDTTLEWDGGMKGRGHSRDVVLGEKPAATSQGASLSGPTPKYSTPKDVPSAAKPAPGARKTRKYTDAELDQMAKDMQAGTDAQMSTLKDGPSVHDNQEGARWLKDYMTSDMTAKRPEVPSDERAKNRGWTADKGAGGGEEAHDGTTWEHRGPALTEAPPARTGNPLIDMQKDANRKLKGETYTYKEGFGEDTGQLHHGFMAQNLEKNPITATAVREDETGIKKVNNEDALRVTAAGVSSLQEQHDELEAAVDALAARRGKKRVA